jgi:hypothetical protein
MLQYLVKFQSLILLCFYNKKRYRSITKPLIASAREILQIMIHYR